MSVDGFSVLGLTAVERAVYELLIDHPGSSLELLSPLWTYPESLESTLARLEERSIVQATGGRYWAVAPGAAFSALLINYEDALDHARRHVETLAASYQIRPSVRDTASVVEAVTGRRAVRQRLLQLQRGARQCIGYLATPFDGIDQALQRGVACRAIYDRSAIEHPGAIATVERLINAGQQARVLPGLPLRLYLVDNNLAAVLLDPVDSMLLVHPSALLDSLVALFEGLWRRALPLHSAPVGRTAASSQRLITLLLSGLTDEAIARQLGLSHRTVQRHVANLMTELGAHTRFQAGVRAALRASRSR
jgi:DNA-binding CsgD family transcriptional regulator